MDNTKALLVPGKIYEEVTDLQDSITLFDQITDLVFSKLKVNIDYIPSKKAGSEPAKKSGDIKFDKPCLLQPGAQKLVLWFNLSPIVKEQTQMLDGPDGPATILSVDTNVELLDKSGRIRGYSPGNANSYEKKYRSRSEWIPEWKVPPGTKLEGLETKPGKTRDGRDFTYYKFQNTQDSLDLLNTLKKMSFKRGFVGATLNATGMSGYFTQDVEDMIEEEGHGENGQSTDSRAGNKKRPDQPGNAENNKPVDAKSRCIELVNKGLKKKTIDGKAAKEWNTKISEAKSNEDYESIIDSLKKLLGEKPEPAPASEPIPDIPALATKCNASLKECIDLKALDEGAAQGWQERINTEMVAKDAAKLTETLRKLDEYVEAAKAGQQ
jgi:hypothetical protein